MSTGNGYLLRLCVHYSPIKFFSFSGINVFSYQRPVTKRGLNGEEETWIIKTYLTTEETFPTVLRRSEVIDAHPLEISPLESALIDVEQRTRELNTLRVKYSNLAKSGQPVQTNALYMTLNSIVDSPYNGGGVTLYREAFLSQEYLSQNPERGDLVQRLREAIDDQV